MRALSQCWLLYTFEMRMTRDGLFTIFMVQALFAAGMIVGFGYFIPDMTEAQALFLVTGATAQTFVAAGLGMLPQRLSEHKETGRFAYVLALPVSREAYLASVVLVVATLSLPAAVLAVAFGAWHYDLSLSVDPAIFLVAVLAVLSVAGAGASLAVVSPHPQLTNMITQVVLFYVLLFSPVLFPKEHLPTLLQSLAAALPPTYVADGLRGTLTDLPGTHLLRSILMMAAFGAASVALSAAVMRRRG